MNPTFWLFCLIPIILSLGIYLWCRNHSLSWKLVPLMMVPGILFTTIVFWASYGSAVADHEVWNGQITNKSRVHGSYERAYDCNCSTDKQGNRTCQTCYEDHYTVKWSANSTIGSFGIDSADWTNRGVYALPDPSRYAQIQAGDPCSDSHLYTNYVQAVPDSLFATISDSTMTKYAKLVNVPYPIDVYDIYHVNHFTNLGVPISDAAQWNQDMALMLRDVGPSKQVNAIIVLVKTNDRQVAEALRQHWGGTKKNDVVLVIGSLDGRRIEFADVISWTKNEAFKLELRQAVELMPLDRTLIIPALHAQIAKNFERRHMKEFAYLADEINPPSWLLWSLLFTLFAGYAVTTYYLRKQIETERVRRETASKYASSRQRRYGF